MDKNQNNKAIPVLEIIEENNYYPFGLKHKGYNNNVSANVNSAARKFGFTGKEHQDELGLGWIDITARNYNSELGRWMNIDPLAEDYYTYSPYNYALNMPSVAVDLDGRDVTIIFNREAGTVEIMDNDHYKEGLEFKFVTADEYQIGGIRDKDGELTHNQILVLKDVFSGGESDSNGDVSRDLENDPDQIAIPEGDYDLTEYEASSEWFKVDPIDSSRYDDHHQGETNADGETRSGYRFHLGGLSHGCITVCSSDRDRSEEWDVVKQILNTTSTTTVPKREGKQKYNPFSTRKKYGTVKVIGKDKVKSKK